ncbi:hypothetical protein ACWDZX_02515 [Streptomyces collinus]
MTLRTKQVLAALLAATAGYIGMWAAFWPTSFHDGFPGLGRHWVSGLGPYNEHLVRGVGALYVAMGVVSLCAAVRAHSGLFTAAGLGWLAFDVPHAVFHMRHLDLHGPADTAGNIVALWGVVVLAALLPAPSPRRP